jgi:hypothetical protein
MVCDLDILEETVLLARSWSNALQFSHNSGIFEDAMCCMQVTRGISKVQLQEAMEQKADH